jgi:hypothetical protein
LSEEIIHLEKKKLWWFIEQGDNNDEDVNFPYL